MKTFEVKSWDDLSEPRSVEATEDLFIGIDGDWYELDLSAENHKEVMTALRAWADRGRLADRPPVPAKRPSPREESIKYHAGLREYAVQHGYRVTAKGYVAKACREEYEVLAGKAPAWRKADL